MICPHCNSYVSAEWEFCESCGKPLDKHLKTKACLKCGAMNLGYAVKCEKCGEPFAPIVIETAKRRSVWDSWLGTSLAIVVILFLLLLVYVLFV